MPSLRRPLTLEFLALAYRRYDLCIWSQSSARSLELKLGALGLLSHPRFALTVVMDRSTMFSVQGSVAGRTRRHQVKALELLWRALPQARWGPHNTVHVDDLARNFAMNPAAGLQIEPFKRALSSRGRSVCVR